MIKLKRVITARIKCRVVAREVNKTNITLRTNAAGEKEIAEVQVAGEAFKHLMSFSSVSVITNSLRLRKMEL